MYSSGKAVHLSPSLCGEEGACALSYETITFREDSRKLAIWWVLKQQRYLQPPCPCSLNSFSLDFNGAEDSRFLTLLLVVASEQDELLLACLIYGICLFNRF